MASLGSPKPLLFTRDDAPQCTPHSVIITALWKYNLIAVGLSVASVRDRNPLTKAHRDGNLRI